MLGKEANRHLEDARKLLAGLDDRSKERSESSQEIDVEVASRRLLKQFKKTADCRFFNAFYQVSWNVLHAYALLHRRRFNLRIEVEDILNRMYVLLFEKLLEPNGKVPLDYLYPWCYRVIYNFIREENRSLRKSIPAAEQVKEAISSRSVLDHFIQKERATLEKMRWKRILEILYSEQVGISERDRSVMRLFYLKGFTIKEIGDKLGLSKANVGVILMRTRRRIARRIASEEKNDS